MYMIGKAHCNVLPYCSDNDGSGCSVHTQELAKLARQLVLNRLRMEGQNNCGLCTAVTNPPYLSEKS